MNTLQKRVWIAAYAAAFVAESVRSDINVCDANPGTLIVWKNEAKLIANEAVRDLPDSIDLKVEPGAL